VTHWNGTKQPMPRVAVIGTGTMGTAMALRLLGAGMTVDVWSRHAASMMPLVTAGATAYEKAPDAVKEADVVITMLPNGEATTEVMVGQGAVSSMRPKAVWAQMATIGIRATEGLVAETRTKRPSVTYVDAPVSGSRDPAEKGQLLILASGPTGAAALLEPVFEELGRATLWLGPAGAGSRMKLVLNTWLAFQAEGAAEAAALAESLQVPTTALFDALRDNPLASPYALGKLTRMIEQDYHADFSLSWALKDLDLAESEAGPGVAPVADAISKRWRGLVNTGFGGLDVSAARRGLGAEAPTSPGDGVPKPSDAEFQTAALEARRAVPVTP
jgi:3-hydroxyisobutyrate dehydrogenase